MNYVVHDIYNYVFFVSLKWFVCAIPIFLPIGEILVLIYGVVPIIIISSSSTGNLLPCSLTFLEDYDALLNDIFVFVLVVGHPWTYFF